MVKCFKNSKNIEKQYKKRCFNSTLGMTLISTIYGQRRKVTELEDRRNIVVKSVKFTDIKMVGENT